MPFQPAPNVAEARLRFDYQGQKCENVLHFLFDTSPNAAALLQLGTDLKNWWNTYVKNNQPNALTLVDIVTKALDFEDAPGHITVANLTGTGTEEPMPTNVTSVISLHTNFSGRSFRGRIYHLGLMGSNINSSFLTETFRGILVTAYQALLDSAVITLCDLAVLSRFSGSAARAEAVANIVTAVTVDATLDSQRRRLPGRGR